MEVLALGDSFGVTFAKTSLNSLLKSFLR
jgi:hypothetical protein